jgi:hypothetical protein
VQVYNAYTTGGQYHARYQARSLRILVVTSSPRRLLTLTTATRRVGGDRKYWFTTFEQVAAASVLTAPIWQVLEDNSPQPLIAL